MEAPGLRSGPALSPGAPYMAGLLNRIGSFFWSADERMPPDTDDYWYTDIPFSRSGKIINPDGAMRLSAVYSCVRVLSETVASLPAITYQRTGPKAKERAPDYPLYGIIHDQPNRIQTAFNFWEMAVGHLCLRGNFVAIIRPGARGAVDQLDPIHPDRVTPLRLANGGLNYRVRNVDGTATTYTKDEVFHVCGLSFDGIWGITPIQYLSKVFEGAQGTQDYGNDLFGKRAVPGGALKHPGKLSDKARANLRDSWQATHGGVGNSHRTAILEEGMEWQALGLTNEDAQFLETRKFQRSEIAAIFRVPPHLIGDLDKATFSNIEQQSLDFVIHTIRPWCRRIEAAIGRDLIPEPGYFAEFLVDGLLRGDIQSRYTAFGQAIRDGWMTRNEVREIENRNPIDGLDEPLLPLNMATQRSTDADPETVTFQRDVAKAFIADGTVTDKEGDVVGGAVVEEKPKADELNRQDAKDAKESEEGKGTVESSIDDSGQEAGGDESRDDKAALSDGESSPRLGALAVQPDFGPLIADAADRIATLEIRQFERRADKAAGDRDRFLRWRAGMADGHGAAVARIIAPLWRASGRPAERCADCVARIVAGLDAVDGPQSFERFRVERAAEVENMIAGWMGPE